MCALNVVKGMKLNMQFARPIFSDIVIKSGVINPVIKNLTPYINNIK